MNESGGYFCAFCPAGAASRIMPTRTIWLVLTIVPVVLQKDEPMVPLDEVVEVSALSELRGHEALITSPTRLGASREIQCSLQIRTFGDRRQS
jgi:hypothetical protein